MQLDTNWYCYQHPQYHAIAVSKCTLLHPRLEVNPVTYFHAITKILCNKTQATKDISRQPICLTDSDYD